MNKLLCFDIKERKMKKGLFLSLLLTWLLIMPAAVVAYTIDDNYYGSNDHGYGDVIGTPYFNVDEMDVSFSSGKLNIDISTNYVSNIGLYGTKLGDLFISTDGWNPYGTAPYLYDNSTNGEDWEYAAVLDSDGALNLYAIGDGSTINSYMTGAYAGYIYRNGQEVEFNPSFDANVLVTGSWSIDTQNNVLHFEIDDSLFYGKDLGFHWTMTCANDVIEGGYPVPEPMTMLLLGLGFLSIGLARRKS